MSEPRVLVLQLCDSDPPAKVGDWLRAAGLDLDVRRADVGQELPRDLAGHAGLVVLGGPQAAYEPPEVVPFLPAVTELLRVGVRRSVPTLGICLGGQLLAQALGGAVRVGEQGPELGAHLVAKRDVAADDPVFSRVPFTPDVLQWHYDEISRLPAGAVLLASSPAYVHQAFRIGECAWGLQFHIETTPDMVRHWAATDAGQAAEWGLDVAALTDKAVAAHDDIEQVWAPAMSRFADVVRSRASAASAAG